MLGTETNFSYINTTFFKIQSKKKRKAIWAARV